MKKSIYIIGMAAMGLMASCSSDSDYQAVAESTINVLSAQTSLGPNASEGEVTVDCTPAKAYTDEPSWLSASIEGSTVKLAALANDSRQSRNAKLVIKKTEADSVVINVSQYGLVLEINKADMIFSNDEATEFVKAYSSNADVKVIYAPEWAKASVDTVSQELKVSLSENTTGHLRADYIKYQVAAVTDSFVVKQFDFDKDIAGKYFFTYLDFNEDDKLERYTVHATLSRTELSIPELGLVFPITVNEKTGSTVKLAALANDSRQSRNAKLVIKKTEADSVVINVSQYGLVLEINKADMIFSNDEATEFVKAYSSNADVKVIYAPEWAKASVDTVSQELKVSLSENTTGHLRADYIKYQVAAVTDSFVVKQFDFDKDIAGKYFFTYLDFNEDDKLERYTVHATLSRTELSIPELGLVFPITVNEKTGSVETRSSQCLGKVGKYFIYDTFLDEDGAYYMGTESGVISATFKYSEDYGNYGFFGGTAYNVNNESGNFLAMILQVFKAKSPSKSNYVLDQGWMVQPYFQKKLQNGQVASAKRQAPALARQMGPSASSMAAKLAVWQSYRKSSIIK